MSYIESNCGESVFEITDEKIKQHFDKKITQNKTNFDMQVKNMKPIVMQMAVDFLLKQSVSLAELLTSQHHSVINTFIEYKRRSEAVFEERKMLYDKWFQCEQAYAQKTPVMEAEFALDSTSKLQFYDILLPRLREHRLYDLQKASTMQIEDYRAQAEARRLEIDILNHQTPALKKENHELKLKLESAQENSKTVDWYLRVMEEGIDTKEIVQKYFTLKDEFKDLKFTTDKKINKLTAQLEKVTNEL